MVHNAGVEPQGLRAIEVEYENLQRIIQIFIFSMTDFKGFFNSGKIHRRHSPASDTKDTQ